jgi:hypothetical protein
MRGEQENIRGVQLLPNEELWLVLHGRYGLLEDPPPEDDCILLTNQRLMGIVRDDGRERLVLVPLHEVGAVEVNNVAQRVKPLVTGAAMMLGAVVVVWMAAALAISGIVPWLVAGALVVLGAITASTYFVAEDAAYIMFRTRATELALSLHTPEALRDAHDMAHGFFLARAGHEPAAREVRQPESIVSDNPQPLLEPGEGAQPTPETSRSEAAYSPESPKGEGWQDV